jgi:colanic acid biosynthesis glycosyl transferase WcaI
MSRKLRIVLHDYPGHAFPIQLSRALARRGHEVLHLYFEQFQSPRGPLAKRSDDPPTLTIEGLRLPGAFRKYDLIRRALMERKYAQTLVARVAAFRPDIVFGGNGPLDPQAALLGWSKMAGLGFVFWLQDFYGVAIDRILRRKLPVLGALIGWRYRRLEQLLWRGSDRIVAIADDFLPMLDRAGVARDRVSVIENWAALDELPERPRDNDWTRAHGLLGTQTFLYSGTLGLKHNPALLVALAKAFLSEPDARVVAITEGIGRDFLAAEKLACGLDNLILLPFQPYEALPDAIASGDVLVALLEPDAGAYSVPSKLLTYCCAGRPILGSIPLDNLASRLIIREELGLVADPVDVEGFIANARKLMASPVDRARVAKNARAYAERSFDIEAIADRFETILTQARDERK